MKITSIVRFGVAALAMGAFFGNGLPVWVRLSSSFIFGLEGLMPSGSNPHNEKPLTTRPHFAYDVNEHLTQS